MLFAFHLFRRFGESEAINVSAIMDDLITYAVTNAYLVLIWNVASYSFPPDYLTCIFDLARDFNMKMYICNYCT